MVLTKCLSRTESSLTRACKTRKEKHLLRQEDRFLTAERTKNANFTCLASPPQPLYNVKIYYPQFLLIFNIVLGGKGDQ